MSDEHANYEDAATFLLLFLFLIPLLGLAGSSWFYIGYCEIRWYWSVLLAVPTAVLVDILVLVLYSGVLSLLEKHT